MTLLGTLSVLRKAAENLEPLQIGGCNVLIDPAGKRCRGVSAKCRIRDLNRAVRRGHQRRRNIEEGGLRAEARIGRVVQGHVIIDRAVLRAVAGEFVGGRGAVVALEVVNQIDGIRAASKRDYEVQAEN